MRRSPMTDWLVLCLLSAWWQASAVIYRPLSRNFTKAQLTAMSDEFWRQKSSPEEHAKYAFSRKDPIPLPRNRKYPNETLDYENVDSLLKERREKIPDHLVYYHRTFGLLGYHYDVRQGKPYILCEYGQWNEKNATEGLAALPFLNGPKCDRMKEGDCPSVTRCYPDNRSQHLGCMTVFVNNSTNDSTVTEGVVWRAVAKGCWTHQPEVIRTCLEEDRCIGNVSEAKLGMIFCCCRTHTCNGIFSNIDHHTLSMGRLEALNLLGNRTLKQDIAEPDFWGTLMRHAWFLVLFVGVIFILLLIFLLSKTRARSAKTANGGKTKVSALLGHFDDYEVLKEKNVKQQLYDTIADYRDHDIDELEKVTRGRFGEVHKTRLRNAQGVETDVAVKVFSKEDVDSWIAEQEIYSLPTLREHPFLLRFIGAKMRGDSYWIVTEWHRRGSVCDFLKDNELTISQSLRMQSTLLSAVAFLHEEGYFSGELKPPVVHRDIKSKNVLVREDLTAVLGDFGLAMVCPPDGRMGTEHDAHGQVGTRRYMSPEVLEGATEFSVCAFRQIDVYATALVMWEITSRTRFETDKTGRLSEYRLPYEEDVGSNPSLGEMRELVVGRKRRPPIRTAIREAAVGKELALTISEMWEQEAEGRITAGCARERLEELRRLDNERSTRRAMMQPRTAPQQRRTSSPPTRQLDDSETTSLTDATQPVAVSPLLLSLNSDKDKSTS